MGVAGDGCRGCRRPSAVRVLGDGVPSSFHGAGRTKRRHPLLQVAMLFPIAEVVVNPYLLLLLGFIAGTLSGFFGVGGGFLITGGLLALGVPPLFAVGTGLTLIMGSSIINALKHRTLGHLDLRLGALMVMGTIPALFLAQWALNALESAGTAGPVIRYVYVVVLAGLAIFIGFDYRRSRRRTGRFSGRSEEGFGEPPGEDVTTKGLARRVQSLRIPPHSIRVPGLPVVSTYVSLPVSGIHRVSVFVPIGIGFGAGLLAGLLGAGGGMIIMPILIFVIGVPTTVAIGTDLFQIIITGSVGAFIKSYAGHVDPVMVVIMLAAASAGAQLGTAATKIVEASKIRVLYGLIVLAGSVAVALEQVSETVSSDLLSTLAAVVLLGASGGMCLLIAGIMASAYRRGSGLPEGGQESSESPSAPEGGPGGGVVAPESRPRGRDD